MTKEIVCARGVPSAAEWRIRDVSVVPGTLDSELRKSNGPGAMERAEDE